MINCILSNFLRHAIKCLNPTLCLVGLLAAIWTMRVTKRKGYLVIGVYFLLTLYALIAAPHVNRMIAQRRAPDLSEQTLTRLNFATQEEVDRVLSVNVQLRMDLILLVIGFCLLGAQDITEARKDSGQSARRMYAVAVFLLSIGLVFTAYQAFIYSTTWDPPGPVEIQTRWIVPPLFFAMAVVLGILGAKLLRTQNPSEPQEVEQLNGE